MNNIKINATLRQDVYVDPAECVQALKSYFGLNTANWDTIIRIKDGQLVRGEDVSHHGSPTYEYQVISNNPKWVALFNSLCVLDDYFRNSQKPEWARNIDDNNMLSPEYISNERKTELLGSFVGWFQDHQTSNEGMFRDLHVEIGMTQNELLCFGIDHLDEQFEETDENEGMGMTM